VNDERHVEDADAAPHLGPHRGSDSVGIESRVFLRPIASPLVLGFLALGGATLLLSGLHSAGFRPRRPDTSRSP
jgi:hypothetical protein